MTELKDNEFLVASCLILLKSLAVNLDRCFSQNVSSDPVACLQQNV